MASKKLTDLLGDKAEYLLNHQSKTISKDQLHLPGADFVDRIWVEQRPKSTGSAKPYRICIGNGRLANTGYLSILPVDQGIEHSGGASFAKNPIYFDPENIIKLAIEGGCNAVATTYGGLGIYVKKVCT
ncbi:MAG: hypothetical protein V9F01_00310 [Chitinophagaceae bacterium]